MPLLAPPFTQAIDLKRDLDRVIVDAIMDDPRSLQKTLGPSEMGCPRCIGRHFLGHEKRPETQTRDIDTAPWLPFVGTAMHLMLEGVLYADNARLVAEGLGERWEVEKRVPVDFINDRYIDGSTDFWDHWTGTVGDWKLVGKTKLDKVRRSGQPGGIYRKQAHIYGRGRRMLGYDVRNVCIYFLPRNELTLSKGVFWTEPYDEALAVGAIENVKRIAAVAGAVKIAGDYDAEVRMLVALATDPDCFSCDDYDPLPGIGQTSKATGDAVHADFEQPTPFSRR